MKKYLLLVLSCSIFLQFDLDAQNYTIDTSHSTVLMKVQRFGVVNVVGRFGDIEGAISFNSEDLPATAMNVRVGVDSYSANNLGGEQSARSAVFLDVENHPNITFNLTEIGKAKGDGYNISGELGIKGVTKEVSFKADFIGPKMDLPTRKQSIAFSGILMINRLDFGVGPDRNLPDGTEIISNKTVIEFEILGLASE